jgi:hypothetical protein
MEKTKFTYQEAMELADVSRATFYRLINTGKISKKSEAGKNYVELAELLRVFPNFGKKSLENSQNVSHEIEKKQVRIEMLEQEIHFLRENLRRADETIELLKEQLREQKPEPEQLQIGWIGRILLKKIW